MPKVSSGSVRKGRVDRAILAGCYHTVCGMLDMFAVPSPDMMRETEEG